MFDHLSTEKPQPLDIRDWKEKGQQLKEAIEHAVKDTQRVIVRAYPDRLIMTKLQYNDLSGNPELQRMEDLYGDMGQEFWLYQTPNNIMEVEIK